MEPRAGNQLSTKRVAFSWTRHCEERSDEAIQGANGFRQSMDCLPPGLTLRHSHIFWRLRAVD